MYVYIERSDEADRPLVPGAKPDESWAMASPDKDLPLARGGFRESDGILSSSSVVHAGCLDALQHFQHKVYCGSRVY